MTALHDAHCQDKRSTIFEQLVPVKVALGMHLALTLWGYSWGSTIGYTCSNTGSEAWL